MWLLKATRSLAMERVTPIAILSTSSTPEALRRIAKAEVARGYPAAVVTQTLRAGLEGSWWKSFSWQDAHSAGASYKIANSDSRS